MLSQALHTEIEIKNLNLE